MNPEAARLQKAESRIIDMESQIETSAQIVEETVEVTRAQEKEANPIAMSSNSRRLQDRNPVSPSLSSSCASNPDPIQNPVVLMHSSMESVVAKMSSVTQSQLVRLIKECADCIFSLKTPSLVHQ